MSAELRLEKIRPRPQLHVSALTMHCGEAFRRRYIENEIIPPGVAMLVGTATHRSVEMNLSARMTGKSLPLDVIEQTARDALVSAWDGGGVRLEDEEVARGIATVKGEAIDKSVRLSVLHAKEKAPEIQPTHLERSFAIEIKGYPIDLVGRVDIQEGAESIRDTKTSKKTPPLDAAEKSVQLAAYHLAVKIVDGQAPAKVKLDYLVDIKTPKTITLEAEKGDADYRALLARVETVSLAVEKGVFIPVSPDHWVCDPKWCGYALSCRYYVAKPKTFAA